MKAKNAWEFWMPKEVSGRVSECGNFFSLAHQVIHVSLARKQIVKAFLSANVMAFAVNIQVSA